MFVIVIGRFKTLICAKINSFGSAIEEVSVLSGFCLDVKLNMDMLVVPAFLRDLCSLHYCSTNTKVCRKGALLCIVS